MELPNNNNITYFAETDYRNKREQFGIQDADRTRHVYVIGKTGMGKSTLLANMAIQDIQNGHGMAFIDPHGEIAEKLLDYIPEERVKDVVYFAPHDTNYPISFNIMEDVGYDKRFLVVSGLMGVFKKIWVDAWSARMEYILSNTLFALLEYPESTLLGVNRMYTDKEYRKKVVENIKDPSVKSFWVDEYAKYTDRYTQDATPAIQNKIGQFTNNPLVRNIIGQPHSGFDIRKIMDEKKILIMNLSKGQIGDQNASLLGSMLVTKIYLAAMSRADASEQEMSKLPNFYFFVDEFQSFANESFADILSEARKYKLNLTIAHQYIEQMPEEVRSAVFGNVGTMISFRVGAFDAEIFEREFGPKFTKEDMVALGFAQVYLKLMIDGVSSAPFSAKTLPPIELKNGSKKEDVVGYTRSHYAKPRQEVEDSIITWHVAEKPAQAAPPASQDRAHKQTTRLARPPEQVRAESLRARSGAVSEKVERGNPDQRVFVARQPTPIPTPSRSEPHFVKKVQQTPPIPRVVIPERPRQSVPAVVRPVRVNEQKTHTPPIIKSPIVKQPVITQKPQSGTVSLKALSHDTAGEKKESKDTKAATREHLSDLRKTLASVMNVHSEKFDKKEEKISSEKSASQSEDKSNHGVEKMPVRRMPQKETRVLDTPVEKTKEDDSQKEVPEDVLRNILDKK